MVIKKKSLKYLFFAIALVAFLPFAPAFGMKTEMIIKVLLVASTISVIPRMSFRGMEPYITLALAFLVITTSPLVPDGKAFARTAIAISLVPAIFGIRHGIILTIITALALWYFQGEIRSRGLEVTVALFILQSIAFRWWQKPFMILAVPLAYVVLMSIFGYLFIYGGAPVDATASNLARTSLMFLVMENVPSFPFGYDSQEQYLSMLKPLAFGLYSDNYNDPHNYFISGLVWGGIPLFFISLFAYSKSVKESLENSSHATSAILAASALAVFLSTSTMSMGNVLFFVFLAFFMAHGPNFRIRLSLGLGDR